MYSTTVQGDLLVAALLDRGLIQVAIDTLPTASRLKSPVVAVCAVGLKGVAAHVSIIPCVAGMRGR